jgi:hypothetical protein
VLDYIATMTAGLRRLATRSGQRRIGAALRIAEQEARLELLRLASQQARLPGEGG